MKKIETTIVAFHIGRGGKFHNPGFLSFIGKEKIGKFTDNLFCRFENEQKFKKRVEFDKCLDLITERNFDELEEKFGITEEMLGEEIYFDECGNSTGLTQLEVECGVGKINIDNEYNTTYTCLLKNCDEREIEAIKNSDTGEKYELLELLGIKDEHN